MRPCGKRVEEKEWKGGERERKSGARRDREAKEKKVRLERSGQTTPILVKGTGSAKEQRGGGNPGA